VGAIPFGMSLLVGIAVGGFPIGVLFSLGIAVTAALGKEVLLLL